MPGLSPPLPLKKLPRSFYLRPTLTIAKELVGLYLCRRLREQVLIGRIVEVEAYLGAKDPASHAYRGKTKRNEVMFRKGGHLYVYFTYGMHYCCNVVTERAGIGHAILLRAVEPLKGVDAMMRNRGRPGLMLSMKNLKNLCNGPAKLCQAFDIGRAENGTDLCGRDVWLARDVKGGRRMSVARSQRVGITNGKEHRWRFFERHNPFLSPGRPAAG